MAQEVGGEAIGHQLTLRKEVDMVGKEAPYQRIQERVMGTCQHDGIDVRRLPEESADFPFHEIGCAW